MSHAPATFPLPPRSLYSAYDSALAKSPDALDPTGAWLRATRIVGNHLRSPFPSPHLPLLKRAEEIADWLARQDNRAKVEAVALALIEGRLDTKSTGNAISKIIRSVDVGGQS